MKQLTLTTLIAAAFCATATAQGTDDCASAQAIAGTGAFSFDNTAATLDGMPDALCYKFGSSQVETDVWFLWTAPADGNYLMNTCGQTAVDTKIAVYDGAACASAMLDCNDDTCGLQSEVNWSAIGGNSYLVRVGTFPGAAGGTGTFTINDDNPKLNPNNGNYYRAIAANLTWADADLAASSTSYLGVQGHLATITDQLENDWVFNDLTGTALQGHWIGGYQDLTDIGYSEPSGGWKWVTGEPFAYTNWASGEPNDAQGGTEDFLQFFWGNEWNDQVFGGSPNLGYVIEYDTGVNIGTNYCLSTVNSTGAASTISASGSASIAANDLVLSADGLPSQPGIFIAGPGQAQLPFFNGFLCVAQVGLQRFDDTTAPAGGVISEAVDFATSAPGGLNVVAGSNYYFQRWNRDPAAGGGNANFSDGLELLIEP